MNIAIALSMAVDAHARRVAVVDTDRELTYAQLLEAAARLAARVPTQATCVAAVGLSGCDTAICLFGAAIAGRPYAPLNHRLPHEQLLELVRRLNGALIVAGEAYREPTTRGGATVTTVHQLTANAARPLVVSRMTWRRASVGEGSASTSPSALKRFVMRLR